MQRDVDAVVGALSVALGSDIRDWEQAFNLDAVGGYVGAYIEASVAARELMRLLLEKHGKLSDLVSAWEDCDRYDQGTLVYDLSEFVANKCEAVGAFTSGITLARMVFADVHALDKGAS